MCNSLIADFMEYSESENKYIVLESNVKATLDSSRSSCIVSHIKDGHRHLLEIDVFNFEDDAVRMG